MASFRLTTLGMDKKGIIMAVVVVAVVFVGGFTYRNMAQNPSGQPSGGSSSDVVFYYGEECPHCKEAEKFFDDNKVGEKVPFVKKETWHNAANATELKSRANTCGIPEKEVGVPFLFAEGKCYVGTPDVEKYFREKAGI
jgi:glutaredoxin